MEMIIRMGELCLIGDKILFGLNHNAIFLNEFVFVSSYIDSNNKKYIQM